MSAGDSPLVHNAYRKDRPVAPPPVQSPVAPGPVPPPVPPVPIQSPIQVPIQPPDPPPVPPGPSPLPDSGSTTNPTCPGDDGKTYVTADGKPTWITFSNHNADHPLSGTWYKLQCGYHSDSTMKLLKKGTADSYALCMEKCSTTVSDQFHDNDLYHHFAHILYSRTVLRSNIRQERAVDKDNSKIACCTLVTLHRRINAEQAPRTLRKLLILDSSGDSLSNFRITDTPSTHQSKNSPTTPTSFAVPTAHMLME